MIARGYPYKKCAQYEKSIDELIMESGWGYLAYMLQELPNNLSIEQLVDGDMEYLEEGPEELVDGDMEAVGTAAYTPTSATLSKVAGSLSGVGTQFLRITLTGTGGNASQNILTIDKRYRMRGWARGDGTIKPRISNFAGGVVWVAANATDLEYFNFEFVAGDTFIALSTTGGATGFADFDDVNVVEVLDTKFWTVGNLSILTKELGARTGGSGTQILKVEYGGHGSPRALQNILTIDEHYRITGWARSDGNVVPKVYFSATWWTGTLSTDWQYFSVEIIADNSFLGFGTTGAAATEYVEFDAVSVKVVDSGIEIYAKPWHPGFDVGRDLLIKDFTVGLWTIVGTTTIDDSDSFSSVGVGGVRANDPAFSAGKTYTARIKGTTTAATFTVRDFSASAQYMETPGSGAFDESFTFTATTDGIYFRNSGTGTTDIDWPNSYIKQIDIPPWSSYPGGDRLVDGDMEAVGTVNWPGGNGGIITKETGTSPGNSTGTQVLRVTNTGVNGFAQQAVLTIGERVRVLGWVRSDGNAIPQIRETGVFWTGVNTHTNWQKVNIEFVPDGTDLRLQSATAVNGEYTEWDDFSIREADPFTAEIIGCEIGIETFTPLERAYRFDGGTTYLELPHNDINNILPVAEGSLICWVKPFTWAAGVDYFVSLFADSNNWIRGYRSGTDIVMEIIAGGTSRTNTMASGSPEDWTMVTLIWSSTEVKTYLNNTQVGATLGAVGDWVNNLVYALIGADTGPTNVWYGDLTRTLQLYGVPLPGWFIDEQYRKGLNR